MAALFLCLFGRYDVRWRGLMVKWWTDISSFFFLLFIIPLVCFVSCVCVCVSLYVYIALPWLSVATNPKNVCVQRNKKEKKRWRCDQFQMDVNRHAPRSLTWTMDYAVISFFVCVIFVYFLYSFRDALDFWLEICLEIIRFLCVSLNFIPSFLSLHGDVIPRRQCASRNTNVYLLPPMKSLCLVCMAQHTMKWCNLWGQSVIPRVAIAVVFSVGAYITSGHLTSQPWRLSGEGTWKSTVEKRVDQKENVFRSRREKKKTEKHLDEIFFFFFRFLNKKRGGRRRRRRIENKM